MAENDTIWNGAYTCLFTGDMSEILLLWRTKEWRNNEEISGWGYVGGSVEPGETPLQACIREMKEETGLNLKPENFVPLGIRKPPEGDQHKWRMHFYAASVSKSSEIHLSDESRGYAWFERNEIPDKTLDSKEDILRFWSEAERLLMK